MINRQPEQASLIRKLRKDFRFLLMSTRKVLRNYEPNEIKLFINSFLQDGSNHFESVQCHIKTLKELNSVDDMLNFLVEHHFIGYLNYNLLKELIEFYRNDELNFKLINYERDYIKLMNISTFKCLLRIFDEDSELCPSVAVGLPEIMFEVREPWINRDVGTWQDYMREKFSWFNSLMMEEVSVRCIAIKYVVYPRDYRNVIRDLRDPRIIAMLLEDGITVDCYSVCLVEMLSKQLYGAIASGDIASVLQLVKNKEILNVKFQSNNNLLGVNQTLLHLAVDAGRYSIFHLIINSGININTADEIGKTPLYYAMKYQYNDMVKTLLDRGAIVEVDNKSYEIEQQLKEVLKTSPSSNMTGSDLLHSAIKNGNNQVVRALLSHGVDCQVENEEGYSPIFVAAMHGNSEAIQILKDYDVDMNKADTNERTLLHHAAYIGHLTAVKTLLLEGAKVSAVDKKLKTPLHLSAEEGYDEIVGFLLSHRARVDALDYHRRAPIHYAAESGQIMSVRLLLHYHASHNVKDREQVTPLSLAARHHVHIVTELLNHNAKVDLADKAGWMPIHYAAWHGKADIMLELIKKGAVLDKEDKEGWAPLQHATKRGHADVIKILLDNGVKIDHLMEKNHWTLMHVAARNGHADVVRLYLEEGFDVNLRDEDDWSAFNSAIVRGHPRVVQTMIDFNADMNFKEDDGKISIHHAVDSLYTPGRYETIEILLKNGANVNAKDNNGWSPLHYAVQRKYSDIVELLLKYKANVDIKNEVGEVPIDLAEGNENILKLLKEKKF
jgi:ankyrin repeat protein